MNKKPMLWVALAASLLTSCGTVKNLDTAPTTFSATTTSYTEDQLKGWPHQSFAQGFPGMNLNGAYALLKGLKSTSVTVGVVDSGVDINHPDLKSIIWTNPKEIANNGIDDDKNGYIDDIHGWNFLGNIEEANTEMTRVLRDPKSPDYQRAKEAYDKEFEEATKGKAGYERLLQVSSMLDEEMQKLVGKEVYTAQDIEKATEGKELSERTTEMAAFMKDLLGEGTTSAEFKKELPEAIEYFENKLKYSLNINFDPRKEILKDDENDFSKKNYGNNNVIGPKSKGATHGTHVAGIIAAVRNNGIGMDGVADNVRIMAVRAVPDGDEYDKDIALAFRYAVDNGAKVINTSFGKGFSPHKEWVYDAIKYAASKDVLIVNAAGNDSDDIDVVDTYPNDDVKGAEIADNFLTVGALNFEYGKKLVASFSNYGKRNVDVFAPGVKIYSTTPDNQYEFLAGTSMASPEVAGLAALLRSYFPTLTAAEVKQIIMQSGMKVNMNVYMGKPDAEGNRKEKNFQELSTTGTVVNARNAVILAAKKAKVKLAKTK